MIVSEVFGPTVQGEGPSAGKVCGFVRLGRCNLTCTWCDTPYTWDWKGLNGPAFDPVAELTDRSVADIRREIAKMRVHLVTVTGGEPLLQTDQLVNLASGLNEDGLTIEVETNGTLSPTSQLAELVDRFNVGVKLANSGVKESRRLVHHALKAFVELDSIFKFVVQDVNDLEEVEAVVTEFDLPTAAVWIMPEGTTSQGLLQVSSLVADDVIKQGWNLSQRLHILTWGDKRGV